MFLALKTDGEIRPGPGAGAQARARRRRRRGRVPDLDPVDDRHASARRCLRRWRAGALVAGLVASGAGREGWAFIGTFVAIALAVAGLFLALFPDVMPTSLDRRRLA